jgi:predicted small metal-binding protein
MAEQMKKLECKTPCEFMVKSHDEREIIAIAKEHARKYHKMEMTDEQARQMIQPA